MRRRAAGGAAAAVAVLLVLVGGASAQQAYDDPVGDPVDGAPDVSAIQVSESGGSLTFTVRVEPLPAPDAYVYLTIGTDPARERQASFLFALRGSDLAATQVRWDGVNTRWVEWAPASVTQAYGAGVWRVSVATADIGSPGRFTFWVVATTESEGIVVGHDEAPDGLAAVYTYGAGGPASPPPPSPPPSPTPPLPPEPPPPPPAPPRSELRLQAGKPTPRSAPAAGRPLVLTMPVRRSDGRPAGGSVRCAATVGKRKVTGRGRVMRGVGRCTLTVPARTNGLRLQGSMTAVVGPAKVTRPFAVRIRR